jgi:hypothetical protein
VTMTVPAARRARQRRMRAAAGVWVFLPLLSVRVVMLDFIPNASGCGPPYIAGWGRLPNLRCGPGSISPEEPLRLRSIARRAERVLDAQRWPHTAASAVVASEQPRQLGKPHIAAPMRITPFRAVVHKDTPQFWDDAPSTVLIDQRRLHGPVNSPPKAGSIRHLRPMKPPPLAAGTEPSGEAEPPLTNNFIW